MRYLFYLHIVNYYDNILLVNSTSIPPHPLDNSKGGETE